MCLSMVSSVEKFGWGRRKSIQAKQATCHDDAQQQAGCLKAKGRKVFLSLVWTLLPRFPQALPGPLPACLEHLWRPLCFPSSCFGSCSAPLQRGLRAKRSPIQVLGNTPFPVNTLLTLLLALRRRN